LNGIAPMADRERRGGEISNKQLGRPLGLSMEPVTVSQEKGHEGGLRSGETQKGSQTDSLSHRRRVGALICRPLWEGGSPLSSPEACRRKRVE